MIFFNYLTKSRTASYFASTFSLARNAALPERNFSTKFFYDPTGTNTTYEHSVSLHAFPHLPKNNSLMRDTHKWLIYCAVKCIFLLLLLCNYIKKHLGFESLKAMAKEMVF